MPRTPHYAVRVGSRSVRATGDSVGCRYCGAPLGLTVVELRISPLYESFVPADRLEGMEPFYPLHVRACTRCGRVQLPAHTRAHGAVPRLLADEERVGLAA